MFCHQRCTGVRRGAWTRSQRSDGTQPRLKCAKQRHLRSFKYANIPGWCQLLYRTFKKAVPLDVLIWETLCSMTGTIGFLMRMPEMALPEAKASLFDNLPCTFPHLLAKSQRPSYVPKDQNHGDGQTADEQGQEPLMPVQLTTAQHLWPSNTVQPCIPCFMHLM